MVVQSGPSWPAAIFGIIVGVAITIWVGVNNTVTQIKEVVKTIEKPVEVTKTVEVVDTQRIKELELQLQIAQADLAKARMERDIALAESTTRLKGWEDSYNAWAKLANVPRGAEPTPTLPTTAVEGAAIYSPSGRGIFRGKGIFRRR